MRLTDETLRSLASQVGAGDHAAFRRLYDALAPGTLDVIWQRLAEPDHSSRVLRGVFCEVWWTCAADLRAGTSRAITPWLETIARRRCVERISALHASTVDGLSGFGDDYDRWTQIQLAGMLDGPRRVEVTSQARVLGRGGQAGPGLDSGRSRHANAGYRFRGSPATESAAKA